MTRRRPTTAPAPSALAGYRFLLARKDAVADLARRIGPPRLSEASSDFHGMAASIVSQQLNGKAADAIFDRVLDLCPRRKLVPQHLLALTDAQMRGAGLSGAKTAALRDLARHVAQRRVDFAALPAMSDDDVIAHLTQVRGIGEWTAQMHLIFALRRMDVWPIGDLGVRRGIARFLRVREDASRDRLLAAGEPYRPWRSLVAWYFWRGVDLD